MSDICAKLHRWLHSLPRHRFPYDASRIPLNGIYVLFESGETAHGGDRVVRVGSHTGESTLPSRINEHFVVENKDRSIFRKSIGRALLNSKQDPFITTWSARKPRIAERQPQTIDLDRLGKVEAQVTQYIRQLFSFVAVEIPRTLDRLELEIKLISTIAACPSCRPSPTWLGLHSPKPKIREFGLWQVNGLAKEPLIDEDLEALVAITEKLNQ
jgi:hypothetical protein